MQARLLPRPSAEPTGICGFDGFRDMAEVVETAKLAINNTVTNLSTEQFLDEMVPMLDRLARARLYFKGVQAAHEWINR